MAENGSDYSLLWAVDEITNWNQARDIFTLHPFIKDSKRAVDLASLWLMWRRDETIPMNYCKAYFTVFGPMQIDNAWKCIARLELLILYEMDRLFPETSPTRGNNVTIRVLVAQRFFVYLVSPKRSNKLKTQAIEWFDNRYPKEEAFRGITTIKKLDELFETLKADFELEVMKTWRHKTVDFPLVEYFQIIARTNWGCQWKSPDGKECGIKLRYDEGEIDHINSRRSGGSTTPDNARWICWLRNRGTGSKCIYDITA